MPIEHHPKVLEVIYQCSYRTIKNHLSEDSGVIAVFPFDIEQVLVQHLEVTLGLQERLEANHMAVVNGGDDFERLNKENRLPRALHKPGGGDDQPGVQFHGGRFDADTTSSKSLTLGNLQVVDIGFLVEHHGYWPGATGLTAGNQRKVNPRPITSTVSTTF